MTTAVPTGAAGVLLGKLIDYAGLFPPAALSMDKALAEYLAARSGPWQWMLGRFICPKDRLGELAAAIGKASPAPESALALSVIVAGGDDPDQWAAAVACAVAEATVPTPEWAVKAIEVRPTPGSRKADACCQLASQVTNSTSDIYVEVALDDQMADVVEALGTTGLSAKVRCGGDTPEAVPSIEALSRFVLACRDAGVSFKATAGLHHPVRQRDPATGTVIHGFLNLAVAAAIADRSPSDDTAVTDALSEQDATAFGLDDQILRWRDHEVGVSELAELRQSSFVGYGSCSFSEPVEDLIDLAILTPNHLGPHHVTARNCR